VFDAASFLFKEGQFEIEYFDESSGSNNTLRIGVQDPNGVEFLSVHAMSDFFEVIS